MGTRLASLVRLIAVIATAHIIGCASLPGAPDPSDPFESYNRAMYQFNNSVDKNVMTPVAKAYQTITPTIVDKGISNFFSNLADTWVFANDLLQLKFQQAASDAARIFFNSTIGLLGFIDVATHLDLPKHNEDFGQTLGFWGVPQGPYLILPFLGSSTIRDSVGMGVDYALFDPTLNYVEDVGNRNFMFMLDFTDKRADFLFASDIIDTAALDPYEYIREAYLQRRRYFVYDGDPPEEEMENF